MSLWYPCVYCTEDLKCTKYSDDEVTSYCLLGPCNDETKSNADRIRSMTDEELARFIAGQRGWYCDFKDPEEEEYPKVLDWLKAPVGVQDG